MGNLVQTREELKNLLSEFSKEVVEVKSEDQAFREEAEYAATGLKSEDITERAKAVEFLEILGDNPYAEEYLLLAIDDNEASVVQKAIHALGKVAKKSAIPKLQGHLKDNTSKHIASEISRIINKIERKE